MGGLAHIFILFVIWVGRIESAVNPGLKLQFSKSGINYVNNVAVDLLTKDLQGKTIPDQHGDADVKIGHIKYDVTGMKLQSFNKPATTVTFSPGRGATWSSSGGSGSSHGDWRYKAKVAWIPIRDHGSFDVDINDLRFSLLVNFGVDQSTGRPTVAAKGCSSNIGSLDIHLHGGASWLYNVFKGNIEDMLKKNVNKLLCNAATKAVNENGAKSLAKLKVDTKIGKDLSLDYRLTQTPEFDTEHLTSFHKGEIYFTKNRQPLPFGAPTLSSPGNPRMLTIWLSEYIANAAGYAAHTNGILRYNLTSKDLKGDHKVLLDTTCDLGENCIGKLLPDIGKKYPHKKVEVYLYTTAAPNTKIVTGNVNVAFQGNVEFYVMDGDARTFILSANATLSTSAEAFIENNIIKGKLKDTSAKIEVLKTTITKDKKILNRVLKGVLGFVMSDFVVPQINEDIGGKGLPIPSLDNVHFTNTNITFVPHAIQLETDVDYKPVSQVVKSKLQLVHQPEESDGDETLKFHPDKYEQFPNIMSKLTKIRHL